MIKPYVLRLEGSARCQLRCLSCPQTTSRDEAVFGNGFLSLEDFRKVISANPWLGHVELSNYGELFLNPELEEIIECATAAGVSLGAASGANFNDVAPGVLEAMVRGRFRQLTCSIDGATQDVYSIYRRGGDLGKVLANIEALNRLKRKYRTAYPALAWQFIAFEFNIHQLPLAAAMAGKLGMNFFVKLSWDDSLAPVEGLDRLKGYIDPERASRRRAPDRSGLAGGRVICHQLWDAPQVNWDGRLLGCCRNFWGEFGGNAFTRPLADCLNGEGIVYARQMLLGQKPPRPGIPCSSCDVFLGRAARGTALKRGFLRTERARVTRAFQERLVRIAEYGRRSGFPWHR